MSRHKELELLIRIGEYRAGADALADEAVRLRPAMQRFLAQPPDVHAPFETTLAALQDIADGQES